VTCVLVTFMIMKEITSAARLVWQQKQKVGVVGNGRYVGVVMGEMVEACSRKVVVEGKGWRLGFTNAHAVP
jgi:hypothetical protein